VKTTEDYLAMLLQEGSSLTLTKAGMFDTICNQRVTSGNPLPRLHGNASGG
jgi:hypothetical protein